MPVIKKMGSKFSLNEPNRHHAISKTTGDKQQKIKEFKPTGETRILKYTPVRTIPEVCTLCVQM